MASVQLEHPQLKSFSLFVEGNDDGEFVGEVVGERDGEVVGEVVGWVGDNVGSDDGVFVGDVVGSTGKEVERKKFKESVRFIFFTQSEHSSIFLCIFLSSRRILSFYISFSSTQISYMNWRVMPLDKNS
jgi:hypothetical protein